MVELKTNKNSTPSEDWLKIVKTTNAKNKIKSFLQKKENEKREGLIAQGEDIFKEDLKRRGIDPNEYSDHKKLEPLYQAFQLSGYNELMYAIACKSLSMASIAEKLVKQKKVAFGEDVLKHITDKTKNRRKAQSANKTGVMVSGMNTMKTELASCCSPIYGDEIVGYVTKGHGVKVHRKDCPNIINEKNRLIDVYWADDIPDNQKYEVDLRIFAKDRNFLLTDIVTCISQYKANLMSINAAVDQISLTVTVKMRIVVNDIEHLKVIMANLKKLADVIDVERGIK